MLVSSDMHLQPNIGSDRSWVWKVAADYSESPPTSETLAIRFANAESMFIQERDFENTYINARLPQMRVNSRPLLRKRRRPTLHRLARHLHLHLSKLKILKRRRRSLNQLLRRLRPLKNPLLRKQKKQQKRRRKRKRRRRLLRRRKQNK